MTVSVIVARGVLSEVQRQGHDPFALLETVAIDRTRLLESGGRLRVEELESLLRNATAVTSDPGLGLSVGVHAPLAMWQTLGHAILAQRTLREGISALQRYSSLLVDRTVWTLHEQAQRASLRCQPKLDREGVVRPLVELLFAMFVRLARCFSAKHARPLEVQFRHRRPSYTEQYARMFRCPVRFDCAVDTLTFSSACLDLPQPHADERLRTVSEKTARQLLSRRGQTRATSEAVVALLQGKQRWEHIDVVELARDMQLSVSALRRRLRRQGTPLSELIDAARFRLALDGLLASRQSIDTLALQLGFADGSSFNRAFRRWTGKTPRVYRHQSRYAALHKTRVPKAQLEPPGRDSTPV